MRTHIDHDDGAGDDGAGPATGGAPASARTTRKVAGRGAVSNPAVRFETRITSPFDDGWDTLAQELGAQELAELPRLDTSVIRDTTRSAISWNNSPDIGFDRAVNPYRGCEHVIWTKIGVHSRSIGCVGNMLMFQVHEAVRRQNHDFRKERSEEVIVRTQKCLHLTHILA